MLAFRTSLSSSRCGVQWNTEWKVVAESFRLSWTDRQQEDDRMVGTQRDVIAGVLRRIRPTHQSWESLLITPIPQQEAGKGAGSKTCGQQRPFGGNPLSPLKSSHPWTSLCSSHRQCLSTVYSHLVRVSVWDCWPVDLSVESQIDCELRWEHPHGQHHFLGRHPV